MIDTGAKFVNALRGNLLIQRFALTAVLAALIGLAATPRLLLGQGQTRLTLDQVQQLIRVGTPDSAIAGEIRRGGLDFVPSRDTVEALRRLGAGPQTLQAVDELRPMLDEAKQAIPGILSEIYKALDQGNWQAVRPSFSPELASNSQKLDSICKPFTYRAHYIESIIERPQRLFEVRTRVLFQPLDEHAYVLIFRASQGSFVLQDITAPPSDWFGPELSAASELTRRFIYAIKAGRQDVLAQSVTPGVDTTRFTADPCWQLLLQDVNQVQVGQVNLRSYKGLKAEVGANVTGTFQVDQIGGEYKIVSAFTGIGNSMYMFTDREGRCRDPKQHFQTAEDPNLESYTLKRFGLPTPVVPEITSLGQETSLVLPGAHSEAKPAASQTKQYHFQHRHINMLGAGNAIVFCDGNLTISPDGTVRFDCTRTTDPTGRCDHVAFPLGSINDLKNGGRLHLSAKGIGNYDFFSDAGSIQQAYDAIAPFVTPKK